MFWKSLTGSKPDSEPEIGVEREDAGEILLPEGDPIESDPRGRFSMYINEDAMGLCLEFGKLARSEVTALPRLVYDKCTELGLVRPDPVHFILNWNDGRKSNDNSMTLSTIVPPFVAENGDQVTRSLLIFKQPFIYDMSKAENDFALTKDQLKEFSPQEIQNIQNSLIQTRRTNCVTSLSHELVHLFVTDEYRSCFKGWGLPRLEMLTDCITVEVVYPMIERFQDDFVRTGLIHGAAYLSNELRKP